MKKLFAALALLVGLTINANAQCDGIMDAVLEAGFAATDPTGSLNDFANSYVASQEPSNAVFGGEGIDNGDGGTKFSALGENGEEFSKVEYDDGRKVITIKVGDKVTTYEYGKPDVSDDETTTSLKVTVDKGDGSGVSVKTKTIYQ